MFGTIMGEQVLKKFLFIAVMFSILLSHHVVCATPLIGEDDTYTKDIELGKNVTFYWVVFKNSSNDYAFSVSMQGFDGWSTGIDPPNFVLYEDTPFKIVTLTVSVPKFPNEHKQAGSVIFTYRELNSTEKFELVKNVQVNVVGIAYSGEENTIIGGFANPLPTPFNNPYGALILNIVLWILIAFITYLIIHYVIHSFVKKTKTKLDDAILDIIRKPILIIVIIYGLITSVIKLGIQIGIQESLFQLFSFFVLGIILYIVYQIFIEVLNEITMRRGGKSSSFGKVLRPIFKKVGAVIIMIGGLMYSFTIFDIELTALLAGAGVLGLVISFAAQDTLSNFFSGMHLLLDRPFQIGDIILLESGEYCRVENVGMRSTKLYSLFDHELLILPNNAMANKKIINIVKPDKKIRQNIKVGVAYGSEIEKVKKILYKSACNHPNVLKEGEHEPLVRFTGFGDSSLDFLLIFTVDDVMNQWRVKSDVVTEIDKQFRKENITIPFPQRTVWLNTGNKPDDTK